MRRFALHRGIRTQFFETDDMQSVALLEDGIPKDQYNRTNGFDDGKQLLVQAAS